MSNNSLRNYEIHQKLGSGSYGVIYKAVSKKDKSACVLKQINLGRLSQKAKKNAVNEATIMGKLKHPFIVCYFQSFMQERNLNILMEYCDGGDLCYFLKQQNKKHLKEEKIWKLFIQICMGLQHIHNHKILHRDLKTLNIFMNRDQMVKIGDLGVAKMLAQNDFAQTMVGTPYYLSPELCEEKPYNEKSDIWALGCLLYEICTFKHPFEATNQASLILKIIRGKFTPIPEFYSKDLRDMIDWCLDRDYKRRPTASMILSKPIVKKYAEELKFEKVVEDFTAKYEQRMAKDTSKGKDIDVIKSNEKQTQKGEPKKVSPPQQISQPSARPPRKCLDEPTVVVRPIEKKHSKPFVEHSVPLQLLPPKKSQPIQQRKNNNSIAVNAQLPQQKNNQKRNVTGEDSKKILFGNEMNKAPTKPIEKKDPVAFDIPWREARKEISKAIIGPDKPQIQKSDKIIVHSSKLLFEDNIPEQKKEQVQKVKVEKKVQARVYEPSRNLLERPKVGIKSGGFDKNSNDRGSQKKVGPAPDSKKSSSKDPKSNQNDCQSHEKNNVLPEHKRPICNTAKSIRKQAEEPSNYLFQKRESNGAVVPQYPPRVRKPPGHSNQKIKAQASSHHHAIPMQERRKASSLSRYNQVSKEEQELVANLPETLNKHQQSSDEEIPFNMPQIREPSLRLNQINNDLIMQKYGEIIDSENLTQPHQSEPHNAEFDQIESPSSQDMVEENQQVADPQLEDSIGQYQPQTNQQADDSHIDSSQDNSQVYNSQLYQLNRFNIDQNDQNQAQTHVDSFKPEQSEWAFDDEPQLPMLQETQTPYFEQNNIYLQQDQAAQKTEEQAIGIKRQHLQLKLKQNMKRQDEINKLMQMKIEQCKAVVPSGFDQILDFFRAKINMEKEYTDDDQREVQAFLSRRNLTDQSKFQNIYKIMHFEMELENTRKIIQTICKKMSELENKSV